MTNIINKNTIIGSMLLVTALPGVSLAQVAANGPINCDVLITTAPFTISSSGVYCLANDVTVNTQTAITITTSNVTLDLNGHSILGLYRNGPAGFTPGSGYGVAVYATDFKRRSNITIRNGNISGFMGGININQPTPGTYGNGYLIENIMLSKIASVGISLSGVQDAVIRNNIIAGLDTTLCGVAGCGNPAAVYGIGVGHSSGVKIQNNHISGLVGLYDWSYGITLGVVKNTLVDNNVIENESASTVSVKGIFAGSGTNTIITNNRIFMATTGVEFYTGATGYYSGNMNIGVATPYTGGTAKGTENF